MSSTNPEPSIIEGPGGGCTYVSSCSGDAPYEVQYHGPGGPVYAACTVAAQWIEQRIREDGPANIRVLRARLAEPPESREETR